MIEKNAKEKYNVEIVTKALRKAVNERILEDLDAAIDV